MAHPHHPRPRETGAITILVVFVLLAIATVAATTLGRHSLREALITGNESTGRTAYEMADSGIDYLVTWSNPSFAAAPTATAQALQTAYNTLVNNTVPAGNVFSGMAADGTLSVTLTAAGNGGDLTPGTGGYLQAHPTTPSFDLQLSWLGHPFATSQSKGPNAFLAHTTGRATIGSTGQSFISRREAMLY